MDISRALFDRGLQGETDEQRARRANAKKAREAGGLFAGMTEDPALRARRIAEAADLRPAREAADPALVVRSAIADAYAARQKNTPKTDRWAALLPEVQDVARSRWLGLEALEVYDTLILMYRATGEQPLDLDSTDVAQIMGSNDPAEDRKMLDDLIRARLVNSVAVGTFGLKRYRPTTRF